ncbi:hypothetical protein SUDANB15_00664 [Streptomyces sp. enrichment culture]|uniref:hypothetical protein n=1 Tax=Streptomyces sp. enrichment culture TaxID=1795815 RepID=UPI003F54885C
MSENTIAATDLTSQYTAQVAGDLERNVKEQERVAAEIAALQEQLTVLQRDHAVLVNMQQALGIAPAPAEPVAAPGDGAVSDGATVPAPRRRSRAASGAGRPKRGKKASAASPRAASGKSVRASSGAGADRTEADGPKTDGPKLVELVRRHLAEQTEPRSAAEITAALGEAHPERTVRTTVVRSTLEGLVARNRAQRTKQGTSVFYTAADGAEQSPEDEEGARS